MVSILRFVSLAIIFTLSGAVLWGGDAPNDMSEKIALMKVKKQYLELGSAESSKRMETLFGIALNYSIAIRNKDAQAIAICALSAKEISVAKTTLILDLSAKYLKENNAVESTDDTVQKAVIALNDMGYFTTDTKSQLEGGMAALRVLADKNMASLRNVEVNMIGILKTSKFGLMDTKEQIQSISAALGGSDADYCITVVSQLSSEALTQQIFRREDQAKADREYARTAPTKRVREEAIQSADELFKTVAILNTVIEENVKLARTCQMYLSNIDLYAKAIEELGK